MKKTPGTTPAEREAYWTEIIEQARRYPAGVTAYCNDNGIEKNNYYSWFKRLRQSHPEWDDLSQNASRKGKRSKKKRRPQTEVSEKATRRRFSAKEKARILQETDGAPRGKIAAILRREGIYSSHLQKWRLQRDEEALAPKKRGPKVDVQSKKIKELEKKMVRLEKKLAHAHALIELQKKVAEILKTDLHESDEE
jgi:transposase